MWGTLEAVLLPDGWRGHGHSQSWWKVSSLAILRLPITSGGFRHAIFPATLPNFVSRPDDKALNISDNTTYCSTSLSTGNAYVLLSCVMLRINAFQRPTTGQARGRSITWTRRWPRSSGRGSRRNWWRPCGRPPPRPRCTASTTTGRSPATRRDRHFPPTSIREPEIQPWPFSNLRGNIPSSAGSIPKCCKSCVMIHLKRIDSY